MPTFAAWLLTYTRDNRIGELAEFVRVSIKQGTLLGHPVLSDDWDEDELEAYLFRCQADDAAYATLRNAVRAYRYQRQKGRGLRSGAESVASTPSVR